MWTTHIFTSFTCLLSNTHFPKSADLKVNVSSFLFSQVESYVSCSIHLDTIRNSSSAVSIKYTTVCKLFGHGQRTHFFWNNLRCSQFTELNKLTCHPIRITSSQKPLCDAFENKSLFEKKKKKTSREVVLLFSWFGCVYLPFSLWGIWNGRFIFPLGLNSIQVLAKYRRDNPVSPLATTTSVLCPSILVDWVCVCVVYLISN